MLYPSNLNNSLAWSGKEALDFIKLYFSKSLPHFKEASSSLGDKYEGFKIEFRYNDVIIKFANPKGELNYEIFVNGKQYSLISYDEIMKEVYVCSQVNLEITLNVLFEFLKSQKVAS